MTFANARSAASSACRSRRHSDPVTGCASCAAPFEGHFGLYDGMAPRERIFVLLSMLGASIRTEMAEGDVVLRPVVERA
jgi:hypothetical protein